MKSHSAVRLTLAILALCLVVPASALADAADPVLASTTGTVTANADGTRTVSVQGAWQWTTRHSDCNLDKRAVGFAVDWNDPSQAGNVVTTLNGVTIDVGAASGNALNAADNAVHPTPNTTFPAAPYGGCGTFSAALGYNTGSWGPISHTYPASFTGSVTICALMYDVHLNANGGTPNNVSETTAGGAGHNDDNSAEKNDNTPLGNGCFNTVLKAQPQLSTNASAAVTAGGAIHDTAHLTGGFNPTGTITFTVYGPGDTGCTTALASFDVSVNGNGDYVSPDFTAATAGDYRWVATYNGDANNLAALTSCGDPLEQVAVNPPGTPPEGGVAGESVRPGTASLNGKTGCVARSFTARVSGRSIVKVVFKLDGKTVKTLRKPNSGSRFTFKVNPSGLKKGAHRLDATVSFDRKTGTKARRLRVTFLRCARRAAPPRFTG